MNTNEFYRTMTNTKEFRVASVGEVFERNDFTIEIIE